MSSKPAARCGAGTELLIHPRTVKRLINIHPLQLLHTSYHKQWEVTP